MERVDLGPYAAAGAILFAGLGMLAAVTMVSTSHDATPTAPNVEAKTAAPVEPAVAPTAAPLPSLDPESAKRLADVEAALARIRQAIAKIGADPKLVSARAECKQATPNLVLLAGEPRARAVVDATRRACECDVPLAILQAMLDRHVKNKPSKSTCIEHVKLVDELRSHRYGDDPAVKSALARFGALCAT